MNEFTCARCQKKFLKKWTEEEAEKEYKDAAYNIPTDERKVICDVCFEEFMEWFETLTPEDHERIRNE